MNPYQYLLFLTLFLIFTTGHTSCHRGSGADETPPSVTLSKTETEELAEELKSLDHLMGLPLDKRTEAVREYMTTYIELKTEKPKEALKALRTGFYILAKGNHPLMEEWLVLVPNIFGVDEGLLTDLYRVNEIELQIARDNNEDPKNIHVLEQQLKELNREISDLRAQGVDPAKFKVSFKMEPSENE